MANAYVRNQANVTKLTIVPLENTRGGGQTAVTAHFNPKEIEVTKSIPWSKHPDSKADEPYLEFTGAEGRTLSLELLFDAFEADGTIADELNALGEMAKVKQDSGAENLRRPPKLEVRNGPLEDKFTCVMESLSIKVTMFNKSNKPVRATVNVKFKEAQRFDLAKSSKAGTGGGGGGGGGAPTGGGGAPTGGGGAPTGGGA